LNPKYIVLDEIDSWLDINAFKIVAEHIKKMNNENNSIIIITHHFKIVDYIDFDTVYVLKNWEVQKTWGKEVVKSIIENGFE
jgi:Fe-S cluster assembly ATP-binding protein